MRNKIPSVLNAVYYMPDCQLVKIHLQAVPLLNYLTSYEG